MEGQHRGRSSSAGHHPNHHLNHSHSPQHFQNHSPSLDIDSVISPSTYASGGFNSDVASSSTPQSDLNYHSYIDGALPGPQFEQQILHSNGFNPQNLDQPFSQNSITTDPQNGSSSLGAQQPAQQFPSDLLGSNTPNGFGDFSQDLTGKPHFENPFLIDPDLQSGVMAQQRPLPQHSINPAEIMSNMSSPQSMMPTPPNLIPPESHSSRQGSPAPPQGQFYSPNHSRNASLDPSSAIFSHGQQQADWAGVLQQPQFQSHRRAPSEHSDVSSSVAPSPFLPHHDGFELDHNPSPMMHAQSDNNTLYQEALGIEQFSLSDPQQQHQRMSPGPSPYVSPHMSPQAGLGIIQDFMLSSDMHNSFNGGPGPDIYTDPSNAFPSFNTRQGSGDMGQVGQMAPPPEINVEFAPTTRQSTVEPPRPDHDCDGLTPPDRGRKGRIRAKSDPYISRPVSPGSTGNLSPIDSSHRQRSLSPFDTSLSPNHSRDPSPASKSSRRSSLSSIPNRDYILELADPTRPTASGVDKRIQKHPATFQCTLCPKRFTRAYNLRSHLRTHTDERPFVCTVCGKAFARQHDRKRHEGLHSGEKKFVCKGELGTGGNWGCGRRFARADALGRHFRSEAGRICIKPLLDEEAMERQRVFEEQVHLNNQSLSGGNPMMPQQPNTNGFTLPAALLLQYPDLQQVRWDQLGQPGPGDDAGELSGRGSYDASSQGEYFDDDEPGYVSGNGGGGFAGDGSRGGWSAEPSDWTSDYEGR